MEHQPHQNNWRSPENQRQKYSTCLLSSLRRLESIEASSIAASALPIAAPSVSCSASYGDCLDEGPRFDFVGGFGVPGGVRVRDVANGAAGGDADCRDGQRPGTDDARRAGGET